MSLWTEDRGTIPHSVPLCDYSEALARGHRVSRWQGPAAHSYREPACVWWGRLYCGLATVRVLTGHPSAGPGDPSRASCHLHPDAGACTLKTSRVPGGQKGDAWPSGPAWAADPGHRAGLCTGHTSSVWLLTSHSPPTGRPQGPHTCIALRTHGTGSLGVVLINLHNSPLHWPFSHLPGPVPRRLGCR